MNFLTKHKKLALLIASIICIITAFSTLGYRQPSFVTNILGYIITPPQTLITGISNSIFNRIYFLRNINQILIDNTNLTEENELLRAENSRMQLLEQEIIILSELLQLSQRYPQFSTVGAEIIARDGNNWNTSFIINKGTNDNIHPNMVVLAQGGLVGRIVHSGANFSKVNPIINDNSSVGAVTMRSGDFGFVRGDLILSNNNLAKMELFDLNSDILEGDEIITSTLGDIFPPGISIGTVIDIQDDPSNLTRIAIIEPIVDFNRITTVLIIDEIFSIDLEE